MTSSARLQPTDTQIAIRDRRELDLLVLAPAGCGKTEALALRAAGLITRGQVKPPRKLLVATFSNRARDNVRTRLQAHLLPRLLRERVTVVNFHGLAGRLIKAHGNVVGLDSIPDLPDSDWVGDECRRRRLRFQRAAAVQDALRVVKQQPLRDDQVDAALVDIGDAVALEIERQRTSEARLTYDDLPRLAELILEVEQVADLYRSHFAAVIVDEFQDLTPQQLRLVNRIGYQRTTYAGDLSQGIYSFAGAAPVEVLEAIEAETTATMALSESHRSSPAVLDMVNAINRQTSGDSLTSALPEAWPHGGLAGVATFASTGEEADWALRFCRFVLQRASGHRVAIIARTIARRRFVDDLFADAGLPYHRWDDPILDTEVARMMSAMLGTLDEASCAKAADLMQYLREAAGLSNVHDTSTLKLAVDALAWCCDLMHAGVSARDIRSRIKVGDEATLLTAPGVHLLTGHVGKGQQFDWVVVVGAEDGCIPDFRATTPQAALEESRVLSVMLSRARHGVVVLCASVVESLGGQKWAKQPSPLLEDLTALDCCQDKAGVVRWLREARWQDLSRA